MRKFLSCIPIIVILILMVSGCAENRGSVNARIPPNFESDFSADYGRLKLNGHISRLESGIYDITITSPESMQGLKFNYIGGKISTNLNGISFDTDCNNLPISGFIVEISTLIDTLSSPNLTSVTKTDGYNRFCALSQGDNACILQEQSSGNIVSLTIDSADISMNFSNFKTN